MAVELDSNNTSHVRRATGFSGQGESSGDALRAPVWNLTWLDSFSVVIVSLFTVALAPGFFMVMDPRRALMLAGLPIGVWLLSRRLARGDRAAMAGALLVAVAVVGALGSGSRWPTMSFGSIGSTREMSTLSLIAALGWWAAGRELSERARDALPLALTAAAAVNLAVGILQLVFRPSIGIYATFSGRLSGLMSNPVYFSSTFIGVWAYWLVRSGRRSSVGQSAILSALAAGIGLSGSRGAIGVGLVLSLAFVIARRRRSAIVASAVSVLSFAVSVVFINLISSAQAERIGDVDGGVAVRWRVWRAALRAWSDRPIFGWGPDPYQRATSNRFTAADVRDGGTALWPDPHNVIVYVLVSLGLLGLVALAMFVALGLRGSINWPLLLAAIAIALSWMLQPVMLTGWPIAFVVFGAAVRPTHRGETDGPLPSRRTAQALGAIGLTVALMFLIWSFRLWSPIDVADARGADDRAGWLVHDPAVAMGVSEAYVTQAEIGPPELREANLVRAEELARLAAPRAGDPRVWTSLAEIQMLQQDFDAALETELETIERYPNFPLTYVLLRATAATVGDKESEVLAVAKLCELGLPSCSTDNGDG